MEVNIDDIAACPHCLSRDVETQEFDANSWAIVCKSCNAIGPMYPGQAQLTAIARWSAGRSNDHAFTLMGGSMPMQAPTRIFANRMTCFIGGRWFGEGTWLDQSPGCEHVEYVRADLVRAAMPENYEDDSNTAALALALGIHQAQLAGAGNLKKAL